MATQVTHAGRRSRMSATLVAVALAVAVFVLATQASSIWSTKTGSPVQPVPMHFSVNAADLWTGAHIPVGCRPKYGCGQGGGTTNTDPLNGSHIPDGCRIKFGCRPDAAGERDRHRERIPRIG